MNAEGRRQNVRKGSLCRRWLKRSSLILLGCLLVWSLWLAGQLYRHAHQPTDALLVLGGSIQRETHAAQLSKTLPNVPILVSGGSQLPCIALVFEREQASLDRVYSDRCAQGTWGNFYHSTPILRSWSAQHIRLITSESHLPRALWMGRLYLGIHGIWVESEVVAEVGVPGNQERWWKTVLDLGRTVPAAIWSLIEPPTPHCPLQIVPNTEDLAQWGQVFSRGRIHCEHQADLDGAIEQLREAVEQHHRINQDIKQDLE